MANSNKTIVGLGIPLRYTLIEYTPVWLRSSHIAAGSDGRWPHNGAERVWVVEPVNPEDLDPRWASVVRDSVGVLPKGETALSDVPDDALRPYDDEDCVDHP